MADTNAATTTARGVRVADDDWTWLGEYAADHDTDRAGVVRRLIILLHLATLDRADAIARGRKNLPVYDVLDVMTVRDYVGEKRNANLRNQGGE